MSEIRSTHEPQWRAAPTGTALADAAFATQHRPHRPSAIAHTITSNRLDSRCAGFISYIDDAAALCAVCAEVSDDIVISGAYV